MERYAIRVVKYFLFLVILYIIVFAGMIAFGATDVTFGMLLDVMATSNGFLMVGLVLVLSLAHPFVGYTTREITADTVGKEAEIINAMSVIGFEVASTEGNITIFKAKSAFKKLNMLYEDELKYDSNAKTLSGNRKQVTIAVFRIQSLLLNGN